MTKFYRVEYNLVSTSSKSNIPYFWENGNCFEVRQKRRSLSQPGCTSVGKSQREDQRYLRYWIHPRHSNVFELLNLRYSSSDNHLGPEYHQSWDIQSFWAALVFWNIRPTEDSILDFWQKSSLHIALQRAAMPQTLQGVLLCAPNMGWLDFDIAIYDANPNLAKINKPPDFTFKNRT